MTLASRSTATPSADSVRFPLPGGGSSADWRIICSCQQHRRGRNSNFLSTLPAAGKKGSAAALLAASLGFGAVNLPPAIPHASHPGARQAPVLAPASDIEAAARQQALFGRSESLSMISEQAREQFFRTSIPYGPIIYSEARRNHLAPELVAAIVDAESNFRARLRSHKNALGLMQILPDTGKLMGSNDLLDPVDNIRTGVRYLRYLHRRFKGNTVMVLAAYNAGEGNIERFGGLPPFRETIEYIRRVTVTRDRLSRELAARIVEYNSGAPLPPRMFFRKPKETIEIIVEKGPEAPREREEIIEPEKSEASLVSLGDLASRIQAGPEAPHEATPVATPGQGATTAQTVAEVSTSSLPLPTPVGDKL